MIKRILTLTLLCNLTLVASAMPTHGTTINHRFDRHFIYFLKRWDIPGGTVAVMKHGKLLMAKGYGYADLEHKTPMRPHSLFRIGSISKLITAVATLKLVQQKRLKLSDNVFKILKDIKPLNDKKPSPRLYHITVRNLLQMSSGWYTHRPQDLDPMFGPWSSRVKAKLNWEVPPTCKHATQFMMTQGLDYRPGHQYSYSNLNYCMLGMVIQQLGRKRPRLFPQFYRGARSQSALATQGEHSHTPLENPHALLSRGQAPEIPFVEKSQSLRHDIQAPSTYVRFVKRDILYPIGIRDMFVGDTQRMLKHPREVTYYSYPPEQDDPNIGNNDGLPYSTTEILKKNASDGGWVASSVDLVTFMDALGRLKIINNNMIHILTHKPICQKHPRHYFSMGMVVKKIGRRGYWIKTGSFTGTLALVMRRNDGKVYAALLNTQPTLKWRCFKQLQKLLLTL